MDNIAHALVGAALGRAVGDPKVPRAAWIGAVAANAPDWSELFIGLPGDRSAFLTLHRGITHSLVGALVEIIGLTLLVGLAARWWVRKRGGVAPPWGPLTLCIAATVLSHLYMDWQGSYGLRPFLPWSAAWYYADWVAIADPFFWLVPLIAVAWGTERHWIPLAAIFIVGGITTAVVALNADVAASWVLVTYFALGVVAAIGWARYWFGPVARRRVAVFALLILAAYAGAQGIAAHFEKAAIHQRAMQRFGPTARWAPLTRIGTPFQWEEVYASPDTIAGRGWQIPRHLDAPIVERALHETREGRAMAQFARFLMADVDSSSVGEVTVYLRDARYARTGRGGWGVVSVSLSRGR
ncbi:MAG TPA: metal-dependent hydrolase [Gemmatimonadales bacterium]|nr:metal-dependent hydrolase [Gemmatimonadales bacterium]